MLTNKYFFVIIEPKGVILMSYKDENKKLIKEIDEEKLNNVSGGYSGKIWLENTKTHEVQEFNLTGNSELDSNILNGFHNTAENS